MKAARAHSVITQVRAMAMVTVKRAGAWCSAHVTAHVFCLCLPIFVYCLCLMFPFIVFVYCFPFIVFSGDYQDDHEASQEQSDSEWRWLGHDTIAWGGSDAIHLRSSPKPPMVPRECSFITAFVFNPLLFWADVVKRRWGRGYLCGVSLSCTITVGFQQVSDIGPLQHACFGRWVRPYASVQTCPWWDISVSVSINDYDLRLCEINVFW